MLEKHNKIIFNKTFYKKFDFWVGLLLIFTSSDVANVQLNHFGWWLDVAVLLVGVISVLSTFIVKTKHD